MNSVNRIITAKDYAAREKCKTVREMIKRWSAHKYQRGQLDMPFVDVAVVGSPVTAKIDHGQWIARCDQCSTHMWVDPDEPIFWCYGCANRITAGRPRPVLFPEPKVRLEIEALLLQRPVDDRRGTNDIDRAFNSLPLAIGIFDNQVIALDRSWEPQEQVDDLKLQNALIEPLIAKRTELGMTPDRSAPKDAFKESINYFSILSSASQREAQTLPDEEVHTDERQAPIINLPEKGKK